MKSFFSLVLKYELIQYLIHKIRVTLHHHPIFPLREFSEPAMNELRFVWRHLQKFPYHGPCIPFLPTYAMEYRAAQKIHLYQQSSLKYN